MRRMVERSSVAETSGNDASSQSGASGAPFALAIDGGDSDTTPLAGAVRPSMPAASHLRRHGQRR